MPFKKEIIFRRISKSVNEKERIRKQQNLYTHINRINAFYILLSGL